MTSTSMSAPMAHDSRIALTRRALLASAPVAALAASLPAAAAFTTNRTSWDTAFRALQVAKAEDAAFTPTYERIHQAWQTGRPSMEMIHWREFHFADRHHTARTMDLDKTWQDFLAGEGKWWWGGGPDAVERMKSKMRAALDSVQAFRDAEARHDRESGMDQADEKYEQLADHFIAAEAALMNMPAPDLEALRWKLDNLLEPDSEGSTPSWSREYVAQTIADYQRLLGGA